MLEAGTRFTVHAFQPAIAEDETVTVEDYAIGVASPLSQSYDKILVLQESDPYTDSENFCDGAGAEFDNDTVIPILVNDIEAIATLSMMPTVNVTINAQKPSICNLPMRLRVTGEDNSFTGELYYSTAEGDVACTRDLQPFSLMFSLGTLSSDNFSLTINDVALD